MAGISFVDPGLLWLLALLPALWALSLAVPRRLSAARLYASLGLRSLIVAGLVLALAGAQLHLPTAATTTVFLLDASDSITPSARLQAETFIQEALLAQGPDDRAAIIVFGGDALVDRAPALGSQLERIRAVPLAERTNIAAAIELGMAIFPGDARRRLVLLSDGGANDGDTLAALGLAAAGGVPIDVLDLSPGVADSEALVAGLSAPSQVRDGQELTLTARLQSSQAQRVTVRLIGESGLIEERQVDLAAGSTPLSFQVTGAGSGFQRYRLELEAAGDTRPQNNEAAALVQVQGPPRLLLLGSPEDGAAMAAALRAGGLLVEQRPPAEAPPDLAGLSEFQAVLLVNVPAQSLPVGTMAALPAYVRDLGRGLLMVGGDESFGVGGYGRTPVEEALPVYMDVRDREERPDLALIFVIDKSGSMDSCHCSSPDRRSPITGRNGYDRKVDIAKEAVAQAARLLGEHDTVGVVTFDRRAESVLPATRGAPLEAVVAAMAEVQPRGSTNVRTGLLEAQRVLAGVDARLKHVILLTDGWGSGGDNLDLAAEMRAQGITLTVVAAGGGSAGHLGELARLGGGRYYPAGDMAEVPEIFVQETITTVGNYIVERPFAPVVSGESPILAGISAVPPLYGFNGSTIKATARQILLTDDEQPLLATWQYGLGRSAAWLSDAKGQWAQDWVAWEGFPRFVGQLAGWVLPANQGSLNTAEVLVDQSRATLRLTLGPGVALPEGAELRATVIDGAGERQVLPLRQSGPRQYEATLDHPAPGSYLVQLAGLSGEQVLVHEMAGMVVPYSAEYGRDQGDPELLRRLVSGSGGALLAAGQGLSEPLRSAAGSREVGLPLLLLALLLLPLDIAARRIAVRVR